MPTHAQLEQIAETEIAWLTAQLPPKVLAALNDVPVHLEHWPDAEVVEEMGDYLLGLFSGESLHERGETLCPSPPQIHLYLGNIWEEVGHDLSAFREEVRITLLHELGHYLAWGEDDIKQHAID